MIFLFNQYRILNKIAHYVYDNTGTNSDCFPVIRTELVKKIKLITEERLHRHCIMLEKLDCIEYLYNEPGNEWIAHITRDGWKVLYERKRKICFTALSVIWSVAMAAIGALIGALVTK